MKKMFENRKHAGELLGKVLYTRFFKEDPIILGIPRGGVEVAYYVAQYFKTSVTAIISKKLPYPGYEEVAFGAISEDLSVFVKPGIQLDTQVIMTIIEKQMDELERRTNYFRPGKPLPELGDRTIFIVDDGIATGATLIPALQLCKKRKAGRLIVAAPISGPRVFPELVELADEVVTLEQPHKFTSVSTFYKDFNEIRDDQVLRFLL